MNVDPLFLVIIGLILNLVGSILLTVEAIRAPQFVRHLDATDHLYYPRITRIHLAAFLNPIVVYIAFTVLSFATLVTLLPTPNLVLAALLAPFAYFPWIVLARLAERFQRAVGRFNPAKPLAGLRGFPGCFVYMLALVPWIILYLAVFLIYIVLEFGFHIPASFFSERVIQPRLERLIRRIAEDLEAQRAWTLNRYGIQGILFLFFGFLYQLLGLSLDFLSR